jgi:hypothetical protein
MIEWFKERYEGPEHRVPHDSSEGGYQYARNEPYMAEDVLWKEFPDASEQAILDAVQRLEDESSEWVRKPEIEYPDRPTTAVKRHGSTHLRTAYSKAPGPYSAVKIEER